MVNPDPPQVAWEFRRKTIASSEALLRILHEASDTYGPDLDAFVIYLAVTCASVGGALGDRELAENPPPPGQMPERYYRAVSRRAIAASTGLPRETVRRKIAAFVKQGILTLDGAGVRIPAGVLEEPRNFAFAQTLVHEFTRTGANLARMSA